MAEQAAPTAPASPAVAAVDPTIKAEIDQQMAIALNGGIIPAVASIDANAGATNDSPAASAPVDPFGVFKEKFGYDTPEAAMQEIEALRAFRASPPVAELKFENETSKLVAEALQAGKFNEVYQVLDQQMRIDRLTGAEMTEDIAADIVKHGMQLRYKDLTPAEINYKFNKQFGLPAKPGILPAEDQEEYNERLTAWQSQVDDRKMDLMIEAKQLKPELLAAKSKLVFPTIAREQEGEFLEWQKTVQENDRLAAETTQAYKTFTPKSIETKLNFVDDASKIAFDFTFEPDPESFNSAVDMVTDINKFWQSYVNPDGTPDRIGFLRGMYIARNFEKILTSAMLAAKNATIKASLPDNATGGFVRQLPPTQQEPDWLEQNMRQSLKGYGGF